MRKWATSRKGAIVILISGVVLLFLLFFCGLPGWRYLRDYGKPVSWTPLVIPTYSTGFATLTPTAEFPATQVFPTAPPSAVVYPTYTSVYIPPSVAPATAFPATALPPKPLWQLPVHWSDIYKLCKKGIDHKRENQSSDPAWDFCVLIGTKVYPIADGVVIYASVSDGFGLGGVVQIYHPCGWISTYGNLGKVFVRAGNNVGVETVIGEVGYAGENNPLKYGPVLHLAIETLGAYKIPDDIGRPKTGQQDMLNADIELAHLASGLEYCYYPPCFVPGYAPVAPVVLPTFTRAPAPSATVAVPTQTPFILPTATQAPSPVPTSTSEPTLEPTAIVAPTETWTPEPTAEPSSTMEIPTVTVVPTVVPTDTVEPTPEPEPSPTSGA